MPERSSHRQNRYDVSGNPEAEYVDRSKRVLVNLKGMTTRIVLEHAEEEGLAKAYEQLLREARSDTPMTTELLRYIHECAFGDLYAWAGRWRTVRISKPGAHWPPPDYLEEGMRQFERDVLRRYPASALRDDDGFCEAVARIQGEFLSIHLFREGNARTIKLLTDLLAAQTDRPLLRYDMSKNGIIAYVEAAKAALNRGDCSLFGPIIQKALKEGLKPL